MLVLKLLRRALWSRWAALAALVLACWQGWGVVRPKPWPTDDLQRAAIEDVCWQAAEAVPTELPGIKDLAVMRLAGYDHDGYITARLAECLHRIGRYPVLHETLSGNIKKELGVGEVPVATATEAVAAAKSLGVAGVVFGRVEENRRDRDSASVRVDLKVARIDTGEQVFARSLTARQPPPATTASEGVSASGILSGIRPFAVWAVIMLLLPILLVPIIRQMLEKESNTVNLALLLALTLVDVLVACLLLGNPLAGWIPGLLLLGALAVAGPYNYWLCSLLEKTAR